MRWAGSGGLIGGPATESALRTESPEVRPSSSVPVFAPVTFPRRICFLLDKQERPVELKQHSSKKTKHPQKSTRKHYDIEILGALSPRVVTKGPPG